MNADNFRPEAGSDDAIRRLMNDAVSDVEPHEALDSIRSRTTVTPFRAKRPWILGAGAAVVATAATIAAVAAIGNNPGTQTNQDPGFAGSDTPTAAAPSETSGSAEASTGPTTDPSAEDDPTSNETATSGQTDNGGSGTAQTVPVYYVGDTSRGPRLYREFHRVQVQDDPVTPALNEALKGQPADPDFRSDWPAGTTVDIGFDGTGGNGLLTIDLLNTDSELRQRPAGMSTDEAGIAVEQLIYTAQAASQARAPVQFMINGERSDMVLGVPTSEPLSEGDPLEVHAGVWIIDPAEGAEVKSGFTVSGVANAFEANVQWELMRGERVVKSNFTTAEECCRLAPYSFKVTAPPGDYTLVVHDSDPSGGEGFAPWQDTKQITIVP